MRFMFSAKLALSLAVATSAFGAAPLLTSVVNSASYTPVAAPGGLATVFGSGLAVTTTPASGYPLVPYMGSATVYVNGVAAPLLYVSPTQVNFQIPWETGFGPVTIVMITDNTVSNTLGLMIAPAAPALFTGGVIASAWGQLANSVTGRAVHASEYVSILATGMGSVTNEPATGTPPGTTLSTLATAPTVTIGGVAATVAWAGLAPPGPNPYTAGVYQINALVPSGLPAGDNVPVVVSVGSTQSNTVMISVASGVAPTIAKFLELGPNNAVIARAITSGTTCPSITLNGTPQAMQPRAAATLPFYPVLSCETTVPTTVTSVSVDAQTLALPITNPTRITVLGDTGCRMDTSASQSCFDPKAWPVAQIATNAIATNPQLLIHNGDYHYRENPCMSAGCAGSVWGYNWDVWREDFFKPFQTLLSTAPWFFVRGNHETCDRAGEGWFRFLDPRGMPSTPCQTFTDPYSVSIGSVQLIHLDSADADDSTATPDPTILAAYVSQFATLAQLAGSNAWIVTHRPIWAIRSNANSNIVLQAASQNTLPAGVQLVMSGHTHTFQAFSFASPRPPQLVIGNSGDNLAANPTVSLTGTMLGNLDSTVATSIAGFGFSTMTPQTNGAWTINAFDFTGAPVTTCTFQNKTITCGK